MGDLPKRLHETVKRTCIESLQIKSDDVVCQKLDAAFYSTAGASDGQWVALEAMIGTKVAAPSLSTEAKVALAAAQHIFKSENGKVDGILLCHETQLCLAKTTLGGQTTQMVRATKKKEFSPPSSPIEMFWSSGEEDEMEDVVGGDEEAEPDEKEPSSNGNVESVMSDVIAEQRARKKKRKESRSDEGAAEHLDAMVTSLITAQLCCLAIRAAELPAAASGADFASWMLRSDDAGDGDAFDTMKTHYALLIADANAAVQLAARAHPKEMQNIQDLVKNAEWVGEGPVACRGVDTYECAITNTTQKGSTMRQIELRRPTLAAGGSGEQLVNICAPLVDVMAATYFIVNMPSLVREMICEQLRKNSKFKSGQTTFGESLKLLLANKSTSGLRTKVRVALNQRLDQIDMSTQRMKKILNQ